MRECPIAAGTPLLLRAWPEHPPRDPRAWLTTVATRQLVDARRSEAARHRREETTYAEPRPGATEEGDDTPEYLARGRGRRRASAGGVRDRVWQASLV